MEQTNPDYTSIFLFIGGIFWTVMSGITIYLFTRSSDHEKRIQRVEDVQGNKLDRLTKDFEDFRQESKHDRNELKQSIETLAANIHKEKNVEGQLTAAITNLYNYLERHEKQTN